MKCESNQLRERTNEKPNGKKRKKVNKTTLYDFFAVIRGIMLNCRSFDKSKKTIKLIAKKTQFTDFHIPK